MKQSQLKKLSKDDLIEMVLKQQKHINRLNDEIYKEMAEHMEYENTISRIVQSFINGKFN